MPFFSRPSKRFCPPETVDFDATWKFMLHLISIGLSHDSEEISIRAKADGSVHLSVRGLVVGMHHLKKNHPAVYQHYNGNTTLNFSFRPDYPVNEWEQYVFEGDIRDCADNGYVHRYVRSGDGSLDVLIRFRDIDGYTSIQNAEKFDKLLKAAYYV